jgi:hypothetical protein
MKPPGLVAAAFKLLPGLSGLKTTSNPFGTSPQLVSRIVHSGLSGTSVTVNEQLPVLPEVSVALQVTVVTPHWKFEPDAGEQVGVSVPSQVSVAVTGP